MKDGAQSHSYDCKIPILTARIHLGVRIASKAAAAATAPPSDDAMNVHFENIVNILGVVGVGNSVEPPALLHNNRVFFFLIDQILGGHHLGPP
jgi:hypothetical protein